MPIDRNGHRLEASMQALTQQQIDEWIQHLVIEVASQGIGESGGSVADQQPRWIPAVELVRRMSRFLCSN